MFLRELVRRQRDAANQNKPQNCTQVQSAFMLHVGNHNSSISIGWLWNVHIAVIDVVGIFRHPFGSWKSLWSGDLLYWKLRRLTEGLGATNSSSLHWYISTSLFFFVEMPSLWLCPVRSLATFSISFTRYKSHRIRGSFHLYENQDVHWWLSSHSFLIPSCSDNSSANQAEDH